MRKTFHSKFLNSTLLMSVLDDYLLWKQVFLAKLTVLHMKSKMLEYLCLIFFKVKALVLHTLMHMLLIHMLNFVHVSCSIVKPVLTVEFVRTQESHTQRYFFVILSIQFSEIKFLQITMLSGIHVC